MVIGYDVQIKTSLQILTLQRETNKVCLDFGTNCCSISCLNKIPYFTRCMTHHHINLEWFMFSMGLVALSNSFAYLMLHHYVFFLSKPALPLGQYRSKCFALAIHLKEPFILFYFLCLWIKQSLFWYSGREQREQKQVGEKWIKIRVEVWVVWFNRREIE